MTVAITRRELDAAGPRREAARCRDAKAARRTLALALALVPVGRSREAAAQAAGMDRQASRGWARRRNAGGLAGPRDRRRPGPEQRLTPERAGELETVAERGPDPDRDGVVRRRRVDPKVPIETRFGVAPRARSVGTPSRAASIALRGWAKAAIT